jgi:hypothetical protein
MPGRRFLAGLIFVALVAFIGGLIFVNNYLLDGIHGWFVSRVLGFGKDEDTEYSRGYSDQAFRTIKVGMTEQEVLAILGPPLERASLGGTRETWRWSRSPGSKSYRVRAVVFEARRVVAIHREFYVD